MASYTIKSGDCFCSIAKQNGFGDFNTIYKNGNNKADWPNPNTLVPGETIELPTKTQKSVSVNTDLRHKFQLIRVPTRLRLAFVDVESKSLSLDAQTLTMDGAPVLKGSSSGKVEYQIDPTVARATIAVELAASPAPAAPAAAAPDPNAHPPPIKADEFQDVVPEAPAVVVSIKWVLTLGVLQPKNVRIGTLQRLSNLGHALDVASQDELVQTVVKQWQRHSKQAETGVVADIAEAVANAHDRP